MPERQDGITDMIYTPSIGSETTYSSISSSSGTQVIPAGAWYVQAVTDVKLQYSPDGGSTWQDLTPTGTGGMVFSDGSNLRLINTSGTTKHTVKISRLY